MNEQRFPEYARPIVTRAHKLFDRRNHAWTEATLTQGKYQILPELSGHQLSFKKPIPNQHFPLEVDIRVYDGVNEGDSDIEYLVTSHYGGVEPIIKQFNAWNENHALRVQDLKFSSEYLDVIKTIQVGSPFGHSGNVASITARMQAYDTPDGRNPNPRRIINANVQRVVVPLIASIMQEYQRLRK